MQLSAWSLLLAALVSGALGLKLNKTVPDYSAEVAKRVAEEGEANMNLHEVWQTQEEEDKQVVQLVKVRPSGSFLASGTPASKQHVLLQTAALPVKDPCGTISCGTLTCPAGFQVTSVPGHCCPYCVNPAIEVKAPVTGATGQFGGKPSIFAGCENIYCFPTLCTKALSNPSDGNGQCCPTCPSR